MKINLSLTKNSEELLDLVHSIEDKQTKAVFLQKLIDWYRAIRDEKNRYFDHIDTIEKEISDLENKIYSVGDLQRIRERLQFEIAKFGELSNDSMLREKVIEQKQTRISNLMRALKTIKLGSSINSFPNKTIIRKEINFYNVIFFAVVIILLTPVFFYFSNNSNILLVGFVALIIELFLFSFGQITKVIIQKNTLASDSSLQISYIDNITYDLFVKKYTSGSDSFFVNAAWVDALKRELDKVDLAISYRLDGMTPQDVEQKISSLKKQLDQVKTQLKYLLENQPELEEYLAFRREQDILLAELDDQEISVDDQQPVDIAIGEVDSLELKLKTQIQMFSKWLNYNNGATALAN